MAKQYAGLKGLKYSANPITVANYGAATAVVGKFTADSAENADITQTDTTTGAIHGGDTSAPDIGVLDRATYDALRTLMEADTERYWAYQMADGVIYTSTVPVNPMVHRVNAFNARDGVAPYRLRFVSFHVTEIFTVAT